MDAIVTAGGCPQPGEPLYECTQGKPKALLDVCGKPMIQWVLDALEGAASVDRIIVIGLEEGQGLHNSKPMTFLPDQGGLLENLRAGARQSLQFNPEESHILSVSSDIPAITPQMVDWVVESAMRTDEDGCYNIITRQVMEGHYPDSRRSYLKFKDVEVCGSDINVLRAKAILSEEKDQLWKKIIDSRKSAFKQAALIGLDTLFLIFFRLVTVEEAIAQVSRRLQIRARVILSPYAEIGMDVDKPFQLEIVRADLARRMSGAA